MNNKLSLFKKENSGSIEQTDTTTNKNNFEITPIETGRIPITDSENQNGLKAGPLIVIRCTGLLSSIVGDEQADWDLGLFNWCVCKKKF